MEELRTDRDLLREYAERGVESAFGALVQRHIDLVFATARRRLGDDAAAREVTQNVFVSLARKALRLLGETSLAGWLHQAAVLEARQWWRGELRRQRRDAFSGRAEESPSRPIPGGWRWARSRLPCPWAG